LDKQTTSPAAVRVLVSASLIVAFGCARRPAEDGKVQLRFAYYGGLAVDALYREVAAAFEKRNPDIKIKPELVLAQKYKDKYRAELAAGGGPDIMEIEDEPFAGFAKRGFFLEVTSYLKNDPSFERANYFDTSFEAFEHQGQAYGIAYSGGTEALYYNKTVFDKAGLKYPSKDWTWDDLLKAAKTLTLDENKDGRYEQYGVTIPPKPIYAFSYIWGMGGEVLNKEMTKAVCNSEAAAQGLQFYADLVNRHHVAPTLSAMQQTGGPQMFMSGRIAMTVSGPWMLKEFREITDFEWDVEHRPVSPLGNRVTRATWDGMVINAETKHPREAWRFLAFMLTPEGQKITAKMGRGMPSLKELAHSEAFCRSDTPQREEVFLEALEYGRLSPLPPAFLEMREVGRTHMATLLMGKKSGQEIAEALATDFDACLAKDRER